MDNYEEELQEIRLAPARLVYDVLGMTLDQYEEYKSRVASGFIQMGGFMLHHLGQALLHADIPGSVKILNSFRNEAMEYDMHWRIRQAKEKANAESKA